jgi:hypothetical protein
MKLRTSAEATTSMAESAEGRRRAPATSNRARPSRIIDRAWATNPSDASMARIDRGAPPARTASVSAPVPQPTSSQSARAGGSSQSTNGAAIRRLHRPI